MAGRKKKKSFLYILILSAVIAFCATMALEPLLRLVYPLEHKDTITSCAKEYELDETLIMGIISAESGFKPDAKSQKDAHGLMQLKDDTALWCVDNLSIGIAEEDIRKPENNILIGCAYLRYLLDLYEGNTYTAVAAYNAGLGNVNKWLSDKRYSGGDNKLRTIPFAETKAYVEKVKNRTEIYGKLYK